MTPFVRRRDLDFLLYECFDAESLCQRPRYAGYDRQTLDSMLDAADRIARERFAPHAAEVDADEPRLEHGRVRMAAAVGEALRAYGEAGFMAAPFEASLGGLSLPYVVHQACMAMFTAANVSTAAYPLLTVGAANLVARYGSDDQRRRYLRPMLEGRWFGTMCLSEPQAGSSLGDIRTRAAPRGDGRYSIRGGKMWISGGDHELTDNIVHMVLARIEGAPAGVKGLSLFIVPRRRVAADGALGERNGVATAGLNHKMGYRGTVNAVLDFGGDGECIGELVGEPNQGLALMFTMMNEARIGVGLGAAALGYAGYTCSLAYARERLQGRPPGDRDPAAPPVPIIRHADVRRMLLNQKAYVEGGLALVLYCARLVDDVQSHRDPSERRRAALLLEVLTPIAKAWPSDFCLEANSLAIQVLGGYGYTRDYPVERLYRDNRLNPIHEGTNGIQALDLLGRRVLASDGDAFDALLDCIEDCSEEARTSEALSAFAGSLRHAAHELRDVTRSVVAVMERGEVELALANATAYLEASGHLVVAWLWLRQALEAQRRREDASPDDQHFYEGKLRACRFFFTYELPRAHRRLELVRHFDDTSLAMPEEAF